MTPAIVDGEQRARKCGRRFAKQIFQAPLPQWKLIGTHATDHVEIFEDTAPQSPSPSSSSPSSGASTRSVRAVRKLTGRIEDVETVLSASHKAQLYAKLLPDLYASGGCIADYGLLKHATNEREHANVQFAMHHAHVWQNAEPGAMANRMDHHLYLEYALLTQLQRTQVAVLGDGTKSSVTTPVPSLLYVLRPVHVPSFSDRHHEFAPHSLAHNQLSVTYVVQQEDNNKLSLEVVLTCSFGEPEQFASVRASHTSEMWRVVVALTRLQPLIDGLRLGREQIEEQEQEKLRRRTMPVVNPMDPLSSVGSGGMPSRGTEIIGSSSRTTNHAMPDRSSTRLKVKEKLFGHRSRKTSGASNFDTDGESEDEAGGDHSKTSGACTNCRKKFHAFRWKKRCEVCLKGVCDHCLSTIANPAAMRKKKRVCGACLYGGTNSGFERITERNNDDLAADALLAAQEVRIQRARTMDAPTAVSSRSSQRAMSPGYATGADRSSRRYTAPEQARRRAQTSATTDTAVTALPKPLPVKVPVVAATHSRTPPTPSAVSSSWASEEQSTLTNPESEVGEPTTAEPENPYKSNSFYDETDPSGTVSDDEFVVTNRARRAQTIEIGDVHIKRVEKKRSMSRVTPPPASEMRARGHSFSSGRTPLDLSEFTLRLSKKKMTPLTAVNNTTIPAVVSTKRATMQFRQLKTPPVSYDLDFDWINPFPKAPIAQGPKERGRVEYMASQLKLNAHTAMVYLRRDTVLEELTQKVVGSLATQWDGCSIHLVGERQVFCLAYSYQEPLPVGDEAIEVVTEDVVTREECPSSYALYHQSAFFVPNLNDDVRFRAHPLHTDAHVVSYLSLPIFGASGSRPCMGTLDLWRFDPSGVSSHVSHDWWSKMERVLNKIAVRIEELSLAHAGHTMPSFTSGRVHKTRSVGSSSSRGSTRKDDSSESDLRDLVEDQVLQDDDESDHDNDDSDTEYELHGGWTTSPAPVPSGIAAVSTRQRRHTVADHLEMRSNNGSFISGRGSAASASSLDFETTIESLLNQAKATSQFVREQTRRSSNVDVEC